MLKPMFLLIDDALAQYFYYLNHNGWLYNRINFLLNDSPIPKVLLGLCLVSFALYVLRLALWK